VRGAYFGAKEDQKMGMNEDIQRMQFCGKVLEERGRWIKGRTGGKGELNG